MAGLIDRVPANFSAVSMSSSVRGTWFHLLTIIYCFIFFGGRKHAGIFIRLSVRQIYLLIGYDALRATQKYFAGVKIVILSRKIYTPALKKV